MNASPLRCQYRRLLVATHRPAASDSHPFRRATTSAYTIERLNALEQKGRSIHTNSSPAPKGANSNKNKSHHQRPQQKKPSRHPPTHNIPKSPRLNPRLKPGTLRLFGPDDSTIPGSKQTSTPEHRQRTRRLRTLTVLLRDVSVDPYDLFKAYTSLYQYPGGIALLSPAEMKMLILRTARATAAALNPREAISRVITLLDGAVLALRSYPQQSQSQEAQDWYSLLYDPEVQSVLIKLIGLTTRTPSLGVLKDAFQVFRPPAHANPATHPQPTLLTYNLMLDLVVRSIPTHVFHQEDYLGHIPDVDAEHDADTSAFFEELLASEDALYDSRKSLIGAIALFTALWNALRSAGLQPDEFSYATKIALECRQCRVEVLDDLHDALDTARAQASQGSTIPSPSTKRYKGVRYRGWERVRAAMLFTARSGYLSVAHINQALNEFSMLRLGVKKALEEQEEWPSFGDLAKHLDTIEAVRPFVTAEASSAWVQEVYSTLRWNEVQMEMLSLQREEQDKNHQADDGEADSDPWVSLFPGFSSRFGTCPAQGQHDDVQSGFLLSPPKPNMQQRSPEARLLGISIPHNFRPDALTYRALLRFYASTEGDYRQSMAVLEDYRQSGIYVGHNPHTPGTTPATIPVLDILIQAFALHGVPADLSSSRDSDSGEQNYQWILHEDVPMDSPMAQWNIVNLLPLLDEVLSLRPAKSPRQMANDADAKRYAAAVADNLDGNFDTDPVFRSLLTRKADTHLQRRNMINTAVSGGRRAPRARQVWTWLVALRRVTGDRYNGIVLDWYDKCKAKFGPREDEERDLEEEVEREEEDERRRQEEEEQQARYSYYGTLPTPPPPPSLPPGSSPVAGFLNQANATLLRHQSIRAYPRHASVAGRTRNSRTNRQGWRGWKEDERLKNMIGYLKQRKEIVG